MRIVIAGMVSVGTSFALLLWLGPKIHEHAAGMSDDLFGALAGISVVVLSCVIMTTMLGGWSKLRFRRRAPSSPTVPRISNLAEQKAYLDDKNATASCIHLQPVERAMRQAGLDVQLQESYEYYPVIQALCRINETELRRVFNLPVTIYYKEGYQPERSPYDHPRADLFCLECMQVDRKRSDIQVLHPEECRDNTPWFPAA